MPSGARTKSQVAGKGVPSAGPNLRLWSDRNAGSLEEEWVLCAASQGRQTSVAPDQVMGGAYTLGSCHPERGHQ